MNEKLSETCGRTVYEQDCRLLRVMGSDFQDWRFRESFESFWKLRKLWKFNNKEKNPSYFIILANGKPQKATIYKINHVYEVIMSKVGGASLHPLHRRDTWATTQKAEPIQRKNSHVRKLFCGGSSFFFCKISRGTVHRSFPFFQRGLPGPSWKGTAYGSHPPMGTIRKGGYSGRCYAIAQSIVIFCL